MIDIKPKEIKKEYGYRIEKLLKGKPKDIHMNFSFRELLEISCLLEETGSEIREFKSAVNKALFLTILVSNLYTPVYREEKGSDKFVRCVKVADKIKSYIRMTFDDLVKIEGDMYIRQDEIDDNVYAKITAEERSSSIAIYQGINHPMPKGRGL